jgi:uroporphyrinogen III methyltransferase/synthase|tara:strand:+ start:318 stop:1094 length:777 start_codon:yes stop_codon:yes gene_type:complete
MPVLGKVFLVGAGPGDPELVTLKAARLIRSCDAIVYDYLAAPELLEWTKPGCQQICVGKRPGFHSLPQEQIQERLVELARAGLEVVRLKGGDPFIFGRGGEEASALIKAGVSFEIVPGITAAIGCAAYAGIPLSHRAATGAITFISGHEMPDKASELAINWPEHARSGATLVLYMAMGRLPEIAGRLIAEGRDPETPAAVVQRGTTAKQRILTTCLKALAQDVEKEGFGPPSVVIIGSVAAYAEELAWFGDSRDRPQV